MTLATVLRDHPGRGLSLVLAAGSGIALATAATLGGAAAWFGLLLAAASLAPIVARTWDGAVVLRAAACLLFLVLGLRFFFSFGFFILIPLTLESVALLRAIEYRRKERRWGPETGPS